jgi:hypothetical protein
MTTKLRIDASRVDPVFLTDVVALLNDYTAGTTMQAVITCGWRDAVVEQAGHDAWLADPSKPKYTDPSNSAHVGDNFPDGLARAVDITLVVDGKDDWAPEHPAWQGLIAAVLAHPRLHGLATIGDYDHIEKLHWQRDKTSTQAGP